MTPKQIVKELERDGDKRDTPRLFFNELENQIDDAIFAAIEEEREACAKIADTALYDGHYHSPEAAASDIADKIRDRGNKD
jgi:vacuolar-type H+-ATPase subunit H